MATDRLTFIAELRDRLTGPAKKATKAVEDLGKASEKASHRAERGEQRATRAAERRARKIINVNESQARSDARTTRARHRAATTMDMLTGRNIGALGQLSGAAMGSTRSVENSLNGMHRATGRVRAEGMVTRWNRSMDSLVRNTAGSTREVEQLLSGMGSKAKMGGALIGGMAIAGGVKRINDKQQANVVLETMGVDEAGRDDLTKRFTGLAQNTPYSTGSVSNLGAGLIASGLDQSKVDSVLQGAIDTGALFDMSLEDIGLPLRQIQATGHLQGDDMAQLRERNIPIEDWLARQKGVDRSQIKGMVSKGQVSADDVFTALASNSKGGAERAAGTLKGSFANFTSSIAQAGEAFLGPLTDDLTSFFQVAKDSVNSMKPTLSMLGDFGGILLKVLKPTLPVLIPLITAGGAAFTAYRSVRIATALLGVFAGRRGVGGVVSALLGGRGAAALTTLFGQEVGATGRHAKSSTRELGGLNDMLRTTTRRMERGAFSAKGMAKNLGLAAAAAGGLAAAGAGMEGLNKLNADLDQSAAENSIATGGDINAEMKGKDWANLKGGHTAKNFFGGTMTGVNGIGDVINKKQNMGMGDKVTGWLGHAGGKILHYGSFGAIPEYKDGWDKAFDSLTEQDSALAGLVGTPGAGERWNAILNDAHRVGVADDKILSSFPEYKSAVTDRLSQLTPPVKADEGTLLQYMGNTAGYREGGFTGMGAASAVAGVVHGREYVFDAASTARIGVNNLRAMQQGRAPTTYGDTIAPVITINGASGQDADAIRRAVEDGINRTLDTRARRSRNTHGTRGARGAN